jgi:hypothetical protein
VTRDGVAMFIHGQCLTSLNRPAEAADRFEQAGKAGFDPVGCALRRAGAIRASGKVDDAEKLLEAWPPLPPAARSIRFRWAASGPIAVTH